MRIPDGITAHPSKFWPFVFTDLGFGGLSGVLLAIGEFKWAGIVILLGIPLNLWFAFPAFFVPSYGISRGYLRAGSETVWLRNAGLLIFLITAGHVVAGIDAERFQAVAWLTVAGRLAAGVYWIAVVLSKPFSPETESTG